MFVAILLLEKRLCFVVLCLLNFSSACLDPVPTSLALVICNIPPNISRSGHFLSIPNDCLITWNLNHCFFLFPSCLLNNFSASISIHLWYIFYAFQQADMQSLSQILISQHSAQHTGHVTMWHLTDAPTSSSVPTLLLLLAATPLNMYELCNLAICGHSTGRFSDTDLAWKKRNGNSESKNLNRCCFCFLLC